MQEFPDPNSRPKLVLASPLKGRELRTPLTYCFRIEQFNFIERSFNRKKLSNCSQILSQTSLCCVHYAKICGDLLGC